ncbi:MAG: ATP-grasp domain-containing protein [Fimbriiglobus sp.]|nr:ATP-grasp domain-containing protein [Fimbriiglobus sp.]
MATPLLIVGASGRAAAASALRAGFEPFVIDLFADADTVRLCPTLKCDPADYPHGFIELAKRAPPGPWMYTGGLENHPEVIAAISQTRELWGNGPDVLKLVRDPWFLDSLPKHNAGFAAVSARGEGSVPVGWVRKPLAGAGGGGVRVATNADRPDDAGVYYQMFIKGEPESAVFTGGPEPPARAPVALGRTLQLIGTPWLHAREFQYAGNVSRQWTTDPLPGWPADLCERTGLTGFFGLDFIGHHVLEVNPRYTASVEVLEFAHGVPLLAPDTTPSPASRVVGKAVYYAAVPIIFPVSGPWDESLRHCTDVWRLPEFADIPHASSLIEPGQPVFTLFAYAATEAECVNQLKAKADACDRLFGVPTPEGDP